MKAGCGRQLHEICVKRSILTASLNKLKNKKNTGIARARTHTHTHTHTRE